MNRSTVHNLVLTAAQLKHLLDKTNGFLIEVIHVPNYPGCNSCLKIDGTGIAVNSDEEFCYTLSASQRVHLKNLLAVAGPQPVCIRFNLNSRYLEVSNILV